MNKQAEKRNRFARMFPARVDTLRDTLRKIINCSKKSSYDWDTDKVQESWILIGEEFSEAARHFGIRFNIEVTQIDSATLD